MLFNIYYLNFTKVYEIKMMMSNVITLDGSIETEQTDTSDEAIQAKMGARFLNFFNTDVGSDIRSGSSDSHKILENFKVTMTKSHILNEVMEKSTQVENLNSMSEGQLVRIDNVCLTLENETELRTVKMFTNGAFKGMHLPEAGGLDINNLFNSIFKDYSYKLKGSIQGSEDKILIKIPFTFESEFENLYNVDDLFIGHVSVLGIYKGKVKMDSLKNSFEFFQGLEEGQQNIIAPEVHNSQHENHSESISTKNDDENDYHYIDLLTIIQMIGPEITDENTTTVCQNKRKE